jgi:hypothetical protein
LRDVSARMNLNFKVFHNPVAMCNENILTRNRKLRYNPIVTRTIGSKLLAASPDPRCSQLNLPIAGAVLPRRRLAFLASLCPAKVVFLASSSNKTNIHICHVELSTKAPFLSRLMTKFITSWLLFTWGASETEVMLIDAIHCLSSREEGSLVIMSVMRETAPAAFGC